MHHLIDFLTSPLIADHFAQLVIWIFTTYSKTPWCYLQRI